MEFKSAQLSQEAAYYNSVDSVLQLLDTSSEGLTSREAAQRLKKYGQNTLKQRRKTSLWQILLRQLRSSVVLLLAVAAVLAFAFGEIIEGTAVLAVLIINTFIGFFIEQSGVRSMEALIRLGQLKAKVLRQGRIKQLPAQQLVIGDVVLIEEGDRIAADMRILTPERLESDESVLTGESLPCKKQVDPVAEGSPLAERASMVYKGCTITAGSGKAVITATGMETELGKITALVEEAEEKGTPLEKRLDLLGTQLIGWITLIATIIVILGVLRNYPLFLMIEMGIALAVAAIPEGLPIVATIALSRGLHRMARRNSLVRELSAVEALGSTTIICTDKTGTLTESKMTAVHIAYPDGEIERSPEGSWPIENLSPDSKIFSVLRVAALCSNAVDDGTIIHGEPTEAALLTACREHGVDSLSLRKQYPELQREPFDSIVKRMTTFHKAPDGKILVAVKGAPEALFELSLDKKDRMKWEAKNQKLASEGFRVLGFAEKIINNLEEPPFEKLRFLGLVALYDPPRSGVSKTIEQCKKAGIRVVLVTGDQASTALHVARTLGLADNATQPAIGQDFLTDKEKVLTSNVIARVTPKNKLDLIEWHQQKGEIVAMTGDGVNDAPALKKADVGIAMGKRGTEVARESADIILLDDAFQTIISAVSEGRVIFDNIRDFVRYLLSCNLAEILVIFLASIGNIPLPILPMQILFLNMITDVFPALALGAGEGDGQELQQPPRPPKEDILTPEIWKEIIIHAVFLTFSTLLALWVAQRILQVEQQLVITISFLTLACSQLLHVFNMRRPNSSLRINHVVSNPHVWGALAICVLLFIAAIYLPPLALALKTVPLQFHEWGVVLCCSSLPIAADSLKRRFFP